MAKRFLIYALGSGWGHLNRALSLARIASRYDQVDLLSNSPYLAFIKHHEQWQEESAQLNLKLIKPPVDSFDETRRFVHSYIKDYRPDYFVVDTFARGLVGELPEILSSLEGTKRILVARAINTSYASKFRIDEFVQRNYDTVIDPFDEIPDSASPLMIACYRAPANIKTSSWLARSAHELPAIEHLRARFFGVSKRPAVLVVASGPPSELQFYGKLSLEIAAAFPSFTVKCLAAERPEQLPASIWIRHWPGIECISAADAVVGSAGYNTVSECRALKVPHVAIAWKRLYDVQEQRARMAQCQAANGAEVVARLSELELHSNSASGRASSSPRFENGAESAFRELTLV